jgi:hypothetical protein
MYVLPGSAKIDVAVAWVWSVDTVQFIYGDIYDD